MSEQEFEDRIVGAPQALGEELLVLGHQLADFAEDRARLDVLAVDAAGEVVLVELKVTEDFGVTDVQALGYAGAYADLPTTHFAETLLRSIQGASSEPFRAATGLSENATLDQVRSAIAEFLDLSDFDEWEPSKQIRIKLVAPNFHLRVLKTVKWLGDVYGMPIEAIRAQLFDLDGDYQLYFERLLPLLGADAFDLSVRERERQVRAENRSRNKRAFSLLVDHELLKDGDRLWLVESALRGEHRHLYDPNNEIFSGEVRCSSPPKLVWRPGPDAAPEHITPTTPAYRACQELAGNEIELYRTPVAKSFTLGRDGETLADLARGNGLWTSDD